MADERDKPGQPTPQEQAKQAAALRGMDLKFEGVQSKGDANLDSTRAPAHVVPPTRNQLGRERLRQPGRDQSQPLPTGESPQGKESGKDSHPQFAEGSQAPPKEAEPRQSSPGQEKQFHDMKTREMRNQALQPKQNLSPPKHQGMDKG